MLTKQKFSIDSNGKLANCESKNPEEWAARTGKNPQTGEAIKIPASKAPKFKAGKALKDVVNTPAAPAKKSKKK